MRLVVLGATGGTGRLVVDQALEAGHEVSAVVRNPAKLALEHKNLQVTGADVFDPGSLKPAFEGVDAVLSALSWSGEKNTTPVCSTAARSTVEAMLAAGTTRMVVLSAAPVLRSGAGEPLLHRLTVRPIIRAIFRRNYIDMEAMERYLFTSEVDWTIIRPGYLTNAPGPGRYRLVREANVVGSTRRADLAASMLQVAPDPATHRTALGIASA